MSAPVPPLELRRPVSLDEGMGSAIDAAMKLALKGDFTALDKLEIDYLNLLVRIGELAVRYPDGMPFLWFDSLDVRNLGWTEETHAPFVIGLVRGFGREARTALQWALREKCRLCEGRLRRMPCRVCEGRWYLEDMSDHESLYTDLDGILLEEHP